MNELVQQFEEMSTDYLQGYLLGAVDDGCATLPDGWMEWDRKELVSQCVKATLTAYAKMMMGQTLPSELRPMPSLKLN